MSRLAQARAAPAAKRDARAPSGDNQDGTSTYRTQSLICTDYEDTEICPVCRSSRYLNANIKFLINPECYHKMCASCVDRIFGHGPAQCPISGCKKTLRKFNFRQQTFEDLKVEREVDIRKRVAAVFNRREEEFEDLKAWNDYLNEVEDITFNLVEGIDVENTRKRLLAYERANEGAIRENAALEAEGKIGYKDLQRKERDQARLRREAARREEEEERREEEENRRERMRRLAAGEDADAVERGGRSLMLKRRLDRRAAEQRKRDLQARAGDTTMPAGGDASLVIKGLRKQQVQETEAPGDPFGGLRFDVHRYYGLQGSYPHYEWLQEARMRPRILAGGYEIADYASRALHEAFSGLGVFVSAEMPQKKHGTQAAMLLSSSAKVVAKDVEMQNSF